MSRAADLEEAAAARRKMVQLRHQALHSDLMEGRPMRVRVSRTERGERAPGRERGGVRQGARAQIMGWISQNSKSGPERVRSVRAKAKVKAKTRLVARRAELRLHEASEIPAKRIRLQPSNSLHRSLHEMPERARPRLASRVSAQAVSSREVSKRLASRVAAVSVRAPRSLVRHSLRSVRPNIAGSSPPRKKPRLKAVRALAARRERVRSASPCSPEGPGRPAVAATAFDGRRRRAALQPTPIEATVSCSRSRSRSQSSHSSSCSVEVVAATAPKKARLTTSNQADAVASVEPSAASSNSGFQEAVLERLRNLCGDYEDAKVLAEYIVAMVAGNKGKDDMASELEPFFPDKAQAESFVQWVEECKWKVLTGAPLPQQLAQKRNASAGDFAQPHNGDSRVMARARLMSADLHRNSSAASHAAVTHSAVPNRFALQPNSTFDAAALPPSVPSSAYPQQRQAPVAVSHAPVAAASSRVAAAKTAREEKKDLLANMTGQLQLILTKLNDRNLNDETREKYQTLAQSIQTQMAKITRPKAAPPHRRR